MSRVFAALLGLVVAPAAMAADPPSGPSPTSPAASRVLIYRGGDTGPAGAVPVLRGSAVTPAWLAADPAPPPPAMVTVAGSRLWRSSEDGLTVCRLVSTSTIGRSRIVCTARTLPGGTR